MGRSHTRWLLRLTIVSALLWRLPAAKDNIAPGELVRDADSLISADGMYRLGFFTPAGSSNSRYLGIWFNTVPVLTVIWVANRDRPISHSTGGGVLSISGNGTLVLADAKGTIYWSTGAAVGVVNPVARLLNTSNFVVTGASDGDSYAWQSFDYPTDSVVSGMKLGWSRSTGKNRTATSWKSSDDPAPGEYTIAVDVRGDPQFFLMRGTARIWRSGPWMGERFTGVPEIAAYKTWFKVGFSNDDDEVGFWYDVVNRSVLSRLVVLPTGVAERLVWNENTQTWNRYWSAPKDPCDFWGTCGPFGVCDTSDSPVCRCMQGFVPRRPENWIYNEGTEGCVRRTPLDCRNGTDGFVKVAQAKLPDTSAAVVNYTMGLEDCRNACLKSCSCVAYASAVVAGSGDRGCILWSGNVTDTRVNPSGGEDLFVRLAVADLGSSSTQAGRRRVAGITAAAAAAAAVVLGLLVLGWIWWCLWKRRKSNTEGIMNRGNHEDLELPLFDFSTIAAATDDFSAENKLGEGGFGPVFKGRMEDGQEVAVKRLARNSTQGVDEFKNEVMLIAKLQHRNLVRLLGCCIQGDEKMLAYEYLPNGSLDTFLFDKEKGLVLDWKRRFHIINGIARGLLYLHQDSRFRIIHRDLKAGNILLDKEMNPKISDFGMARIFGGDQTEANTRRVVGTYGYMSPEYIMDGVFSIKSDVFSFGVLMLEIVSGRRNRGVYLSDPTLNLIGNAWSLWKAGNWMELVDESMADGFPVAEVLRCVNLALLCVQERPEGRPTMAWVVQMLGIDTTASLLPQPKQPGFMATRGPFEVSSSGSVNEVTMTMFQGR